MHNTEKGYSFSSGSPKLCTVLGTQQAFNQHLFKQYMEKRRENRKRTVWVLRHDLEVRSLPGPDAIEALPQLQIWCGPMKESRVGQERASNPVGLPTSGAHLTLWRKYHREHQNDLE